MLLTGIRVFIEKAVQQIGVLVFSIVCRVKMPLLILSNNIPLNTNQDKA